jgi:hypothetical protein
LRLCLRPKQRLLLSLHQQSSDSYFKGRPASTSFPEKSQTERNPHAENEKQTGKNAKKLVKTIAQLDEELRMKMEDRSGDGGDAGIELEDGKPTAMKRGVRENMFRLI